MKNKICFENVLKDVVTAKHLKESPVHNWLVFPHSYSFALIELLIDRWGLTSTDMILDPFCGAGTTLLAAKKCNISAKGYDISPFSVFISNVKTACYNIDKLHASWEKIRLKLQKPKKYYPKTRDYHDLIIKAFPGILLKKIEKIDEIINSTVQDNQERDFFRLALFAIMPSFSYAYATGGWLKWSTPKKKQNELYQCYTAKVEHMLNDLPLCQYTKLCNFAYKGDTRFLPELDESFSAIITSPPYPNRHDYTRVFGVELMYGFLDWHETRDVRYQSLQSHPESKPKRPNYDDYIPPSCVEHILKLLQKHSTPRIVHMVEGYFIDMHCTLKEMKRVCKKNAYIALVLGNAQYNGVQVLVDECTAAIGEQNGLTCEEIIVARERGNSAQQMRIYGKKPSRESIIILKK